jgi:acetate kinase
VHVLMVNCGSSSLKFDLMVLDDTGLVVTRPVRGEVERIGADATLHAAGTSSTVDRRVEAGDHGHAVRVALEWLGEAGYSTAAGIDAVAHRVVHGGARFVDATVVDDDVLQAIDAATALAPLHNRPALAALHASRDVLGPGVPMVAVFDTAFHATMPLHSSQYAIDPELAQRHDIRRYGFHGLAHRSMTERVAALSGVDTEGSRLVTLQLGNGCSAAAVHGGRSVDTSMGLTPLEGLVMGTRSGDVDPSLPAYLAASEHVSVAEVEDWLNTRSGLLGLSGRSRDMRDLLTAAADGDTRSALAVDLFCYRARKVVGAYMAVLGGADAVVFGGGIGEHEPEVRRRVLDGMEWAGVAIDALRNGATTGGREARIDADGSELAVWVVHVDEASVAARDVARVLAATR